MSRKEIDMQHYPRRDHFDHFRVMENPFIMLTDEVDISEWMPKIKKAGYPFFLSFQYALCRAANRIPEFRQRIVGDGIVEYDVCDPSYTYGLPDGTYRYCRVNVMQPFPDYVREARRKEAEALHAEHLAEEGDIMSLFFTSCVPWVSYTGLIMPYPDRNLSIPNIVWGKYKKEKVLVLEDGKVTEKEKITIPVTLLVNHALVDGIHIGRFWANVEEELRGFHFS